MLTAISLFFIICGWIILSIINALYNFCVSFFISTIHFSQRVFGTIPYIFEIIKPVLLITFFSLLLLTIGCSIALKLIWSSKIDLIKKSNYILNSEKNNIIPIDIKYQGKNGWLVYTISPLLGDNYELIWKEVKYSLNEINLPNKSLKNDSTLEKWEEIGKLVKNKMKIDCILKEYKQKIDEIEQAGKIAVSSSIYVKYIEQYEKAKILLQTEIEKGQALVKQIHNNIREILISNELSLTENYLNSVVYDLLDRETLFDEHHKDIKEKYEYILNEAEAYLQIREEFFTQNF
ncbi:MAG: hypothetical protein V7K32_17470 [Nostoc sp.]|uniref:hypothetical protein n=1 Tax=Nostoc sp. TaxID=1180 RepID=UPI002FF47330